MVPPSLSSAVVDVKIEARHHMIAKRLSLFNLCLHPSVTYKSIIQTGNSLSAARFLALRPAFLTSCITTYNLAYDLVCMPQ